MQRRTKIVGALGAGALLVGAAVGVGSATGGSPRSSIQIQTAEPGEAGANASYPGTVETSVSVEGDDRVTSGEEQTVVVEVQVAGDARPQGRLTVVFTRQGGDYREERTMTYTGRPVVVRSSSLGQNGRYVATATFDAPDDAVWQDSQGQFAFQVVGKGS